MTIKFKRLIAKIIISLIGLLFFLVSLFEIFGSTFYFFYFDTSNVMVIPHHRLQALRITVLLTFSYFSFRYLIYESVKFYPIQFLDIIFKISMLTSLVIYTTNDVEIREYLVLAFGFFVTIITHIASRPKLRRHYYSKFSKD